MKWNREIELPIPWFLVYLLAVMLAMVPVCGCRDESAGEASTPNARDAEYVMPQEQECISRFEFPLPKKSYRAGFRPFASFLNPPSHLGEDIRGDAGTPVRSIAEGKIVWYGPSRGYGTLVAAIEHTFEDPISVRNGNGDHIITSHLLSIYGYLRRNETAQSIPLRWNVGEKIRKGDVIGYINDDASNGIGREHVHFGIRLENFIDASRHDPEGWFRAYDREGMFQADFAAPSPTLATLTQICSPPFDLSPFPFDAGD